MSWVWCFLPTLLNALAGDEAPAYWSAAWAAEPWVSLTFPTQFTSMCQERAETCSFTRFLGAVILCFWFVEDHSAPTDLEGKQDHDLVLSKLILACADYEDLLRLNKPQMKTRHCAITSLLVASFKKAVSWAVSSQSLTWDTWAGEKLARHHCVLLWLRMGKQILFPQQILGRRESWYILML